MKDEMQEPEIVEPELLIDEETRSKFSQDQKKQFDQATIQLQRPLVGRFIAFIFLLFFLPFAFFALIYACTSTLMASVMLGRHKILNAQMVRGWYSVAGLFGVAISSIIGLVSPAWGLKTGINWLFLFMRF